MIRHLGSMRRWTNLLNIYDILFFLLFRIQRDLGWINLCLLRLLHVLALFQNLTDYGDCVHSREDGHYASCHGWLHHDIHLHASCVPGDQDQLKEYIGLWYVTRPPTRQSQDSLFSNKLYLALSVFQWSCVEDLQVDTLILWRDLLTTHGKLSTWRTCSIYRWQSYCWHFLLKWELRMELMNWRQRL